MLREVKIADVKVANRHRKDMGDVQALADSIRELGLLQPIGVTRKLELVFGERRLRAHKLLKEKTILARIVDVPSIVRGERDENEIRKDFTPSERVAIAKAVEREIGNRRGQRNDKLVASWPQVGAGRKTREIAAERAGFTSDQSYRRAVKVIETGTDQLIQAMDEGRVSISAGALLADLDADEQDIILQLDPQAILQAAREIRARHAERRAEQQNNHTPKPVKRPSRERLKATQLIQGDCRKELKKLPDRSADLIVTDPPYPEINREYGRMSEADWHAMMHEVVAESRRVLKPHGSMVVILQPNFEKIGRMRLWLWEFMVWAGREWNLVQDAYWWAANVMPLIGANRKHGLMRQSVKMCVWLGSPDCYRNQDKVLWLPSDVIFMESKADMARRHSPGRSWRNGGFGKTAAERHGSTPFNLLPIPVGDSIETGHPARTPYRVAEWWCKYLLPPGGVLVDPFCGSGTMLAAALDYGASRVIGIDSERKYLTTARQRIGEASPASPPTTTRAPRR